MAQVEWSGAAPVLRRNAGPPPHPAPFFPSPCSDYNQKHFVRNEGFQEAADAIQGDMRKIFIEFLERSCTAGGLGS